MSTLSEMLGAFNDVKDHTRLGFMIKYPTKFEPENDHEYHAYRLYKQFLETYFNNHYSAYITAETIKQVLDSSDEIYNPAKLERCAAFIRNKLRPTQVLTDDWIIYFVRRFR